MAAKKLNVSEAIAFGWRGVWRRFWFWLGVLAIMFGVQFALQFLQGGFGVLGDRGVFLPFAIGGFGIFFLVALALQLVFALGLLRIAITVVDGGEPRYGMLLSEYKLIWRFIGSSLLYGVILWFGFLLLIIPGIIWGLMFMFYRYSLVDKNMSVFDSLSRSREMTRGVKWQLMGLFILLYFINVLGAMLFGLGLLVTIPLSWLATAHAYRQLEPRAAKRPSGLVATRVLESAVVGES